MVGVPVSWPRPADGILDECGEQNWDDYLEHKIDYTNFYQFFLFLKNSVEKKASEEKIVEVVAVFSDEIDHFDEIWMVQAEVSERGS